MQSDQRNTDLAKIRKMGRTAFAICCCVAGLLFLGNSPMEERSASLFAQTPDITGNTPPATPTALPPALSIPFCELPDAEISVHEKNAEIFLNRCRTHLRSTSAIDAKVEYAAFLLGEKMTGTGVYLEQKSENDIFNMYFRITHKRNNYHLTQNLLLDGHNQKFWQNHSVKWDAPATDTDDSQNSQRKQLQALSQQYASVNMERIRNLYASNPARYRMIAPPWYGVNSLENIIYEIQQNFRFYSSAETVLQRTPHEIKVFRVEGEWRKEAIQGIFTARQIPFSAAGSPKNFARQTPDEFPSTVAVYVDRENYFPYLIEYYRPEENGKQKIMLQLAFYEVLFNVRFQAGQFIFQIPPGCSELDRTNEFLEYRLPKKSETP